MAASKKDSEVPTHKIIIIGSLGCGKTSLLRRYGNNLFFENNEPGIGAILKKISYEYPKDSDKKCVLEIWDIAGTEKMKRLLMGYLNDVKTCVLVFDRTNQESFDNLESWLELVKNYAPKCNLILVGTKKDLSTENLLERSIFIEKTEEFMIKHGPMSYMETSAKENEHVTELFDAIAENLRPAAIKTEPATINEEKVRSSPRPCSIQ